ncbi:MAG: hypothetical protein ACHQ4H_02250 [Ktedonobacterales bacterium]
MLSSNPIINFFLQIFTVRGTFSWNAVADNLFNPFVLQGVVLVGRRDRRVRRTGPRPRAGNRPPR